MSRKFSGSQSGQDGVRFLEQDGNPDAHGVSEVIVTNGTLTALGNGIIELGTGGGGGGSTGPQGATGPAFLNVSDVVGSGKGKCSIRFILLQSIILNKWRIWPTKI